MIVTVNHAGANNEFGELKLCLTSVSVVFASFGI